MKKKCIVLGICALMLSSCSGGNTATEQTTSSAIINEDTASINDPEQIDFDDPYLNYDLGIKNGIYGWTLSEDGSYYMLSAINEDGSVTESKAEQNFMPRGGKPDGGAIPDGGISDRGMRDGDPLAMEKNMQESSVSVNAQGVNTESNITNTEYQTMLIFVPSEYILLNEDGTASFTDKEIGGYTAATAPIIFQNNNGGWRSGSPKAPEYSDTLAAGMIYVSCGSRSRDAKSEDGTPTGKVPTPVADLKAGVIALRANTETIPGDKNKIISVGASGGGQMSSVLGASGNMKEYFPYLYESGAIGVTYNEETQEYLSAYDDSVYAAMCYCPIADIENADMAYAWIRYDSTYSSNPASSKFSESVGSYNFTQFQLALQEDEAQAFGKYVNSLDLKDINGSELKFDEKEDGSINLRSGSYYEKTLENISDALNKYLVAESDPDGYLSENYGDTSSWLTKENGKYKVTNLAAFINGTKLVRNKDIPGFDALDLSAENDAFGRTEDSAVHFSTSIAKLIKENYEKYSVLDGFEAAQADMYIDNALDGDLANIVDEQTDLVNATQIMLDKAAGKNDANIAKYWRTRNGTADQHTSFSIAYNICLAAQMAGSKADYSLV
ncbi:MAG: hypothetical protein IJ736_07775, partial [Firmicutes bacterium]|nr:hypothetical protein [Bacillota bacterium]